MSELLEKILSKDNMNAAYKESAPTKAGGVDDVTVEEPGAYVKENWESIREQIRRRKYTPQPVRRVEIHKPDGREETGNTHGFFILQPPNDVLECCLQFSRRQLI